MLAAEQVIHGRVLDTHGSPVSGAELRLDKVDLWGESSSRVVANRVFNGDPDTLTFRGSITERLNGFLAPVVSNADGRFACADLAARCWRGFSSMTQGSPSNAS